jgi:flagellar biosynthetic protein FliO
MVTNVAGKLAVVVALILACAAVWRKFQYGLPQSGPAPAQSVKVTSTLPLGPQRFLHLVTVGGQQLLLGSTAQSITLIAALDENQRLAGIPSVWTSMSTWQPSTASSEFEPPAGVGLASSPPGERFEELLLRLRDLETEKAEKLPSDTARARGDRSDARWGPVAASQPLPENRGGPRSQVARSHESSRETEMARDRDEGDPRITGPTATGMPEAYAPGSLFRIAARKSRSDGHA